MSEGQKTPAGDEESELMRQIRSGRKFSLSDAIGQMAGGDLMKGASPVTRKRQAEVEIKHYLETHLSDVEGALRVVLTRRIGESEIFLSNFDQPLVVLIDFLRHILESEDIFKDLVDEIDAEWGRIYDERPHFEKQGVEPDRDDPYTFVSVRATLAQLIEQLCGGGQ